MVVPVDVEYPFVGRWLTQNSPANRVPSHGTTVLGTSYAIDFVPVDAAGRTAPISFRSLWRPESTHLFPGFGRPLLAPADGTVVGTLDAEPDHESFRGLPSVGNALTQRRRAAAGWVALAGDMVARCGNSGNSTEPHVHVQGIDRRDVDRASAVPLTFRGGVPRNGEIVEVT